jgi:hypothetical protein
MQQVAIVLADAQGTPVNHTFSVNGSTGIPMGRDVVQRAEFVDRSATSPIGNWKILMDYKQRTSDGTWKQVVHLKLPVLENVSNSTISGIAPAPTVAYTVEAKCEFTVPERATLLDRQNVRKMMDLLLANSQVVALVESPERITS